ncbi:hypothetical protein [Microbacterium sp. NPDC086615]|uniref:hypothetical protein n=1 Tax=Microbacterium sp. NPDC086615 TaxID=3154865 RepID=UPI00341B4025
MALGIAAVSIRMSLTTLLLLAIVSVVSGYRSWALGLLLAAVLCVALPRVDRIRRTSTASKFMLFAAIAAGSAWLVFELVLGGLFGEPVRERTELQLRWGDGNIVLGGRSEWGAALAGFIYRPLGFGSGVGPAAIDWAPIISGQRVPDGLKDYTTVAQYMTAGRIEFHSTFWNFWSHYGLVGMVLIAYAGWMLIRSSIGSASVANPTSIVVVVLMVEILWNLLFSPTVIVTLGVAMGVALFKLHADDERPPLLPAPSE